MAESPKPLAMMSLHALTDDLIRMQHRLKRCLTDESRRDYADRIKALEGELYKRRTRA